MSASGFKKLPGGLRSKPKQLNARESFSLTNRDASVETPCHSCNPKSIVPFWKNPIGSTRQSAFLRKPVRNADDDDDDDNDHALFDGRFRELPGGVRVRSSVAVFAGRGMPWQIWHDAHPIA